MFTGYPTIWTLPLIWEHVHRIPNNVTWIQILDLVLGEGQILSPDLFWLAQDKAQLDHSTFNKHRRPTKSTCKFAQLLFSLNWVIKERFLSNLVVTVGYSTQTSCPLQILLRPLGWQEMNLGTRFERVRFMVALISLQESFFLLSSLVFLPPHKPTFLSVNSNWTKWSTWKTPVGDLWISSSNNMSIFSNKFIQHVCTNSLN